MTKQALDATIADMAGPFLTSLGLELWGIEFSYGGRTLVRIFVDGPEGVTIDQCAEVSRHVGLALEVEDVISSAYVLEVSSPGLERPFFRAEQMSPYVGRQIELTLTEPTPEWPGRRKFRGELVAVEGDTVVLRPEGAPEAEADGAVLRTTWQGVRKANLIHVFPEPGHKPRR